MFQRYPIRNPPQSGGRFDLKLSASSDDSNLAQEGVITVAIGTRYSSYCANIARCAAVYLPCISVLCSSILCTQQQCAAVCLAHDLGYTPFGGRG